MARTEAEQWAADLARTTPDPIAEYNNAVIEERTRTSTLNARREAFEDDQSWTAHMKNSVVDLFSSDESRLAEGKRLSQKTGLPESLILHDNDTFQKSREVARDMDRMELFGKAGGTTDISSLYPQLPGLQKMIESGRVTDAALYLKNIENVKKVQNMIFTPYKQREIEKLEQLKAGAKKGVGGYTWSDAHEEKLQQLIEKRNQDPTAYWTAQKAAHRKGELEIEISLLHAKKARAEHLGVEGFSENDKALLHRWQTELDHLPTYGDNGFFEAVVTGTAEQIPLLWGTVKSGIEGAAIGGAIGGTAGSLGAGAGAAPGAVIGAGYGGRAGAFGYMQQVSMGRYYDEYLNMTDANGEKVFTPKEAFMWANIQGTAEAGIETLALKGMGSAIAGKLPARFLSSSFGKKVLSKTVKADVAAAISGSASESIAKSTATGILKNSFISALKVGGIEASEEAVQEAASMVIENAMFYQKKKEGFDLEMHSFGDIVSQSIDAGFEALPASLGLGILGGGASVPAQFRSRYRYQSSQQALSEMGSKIEKNSVGQRTLDRMKNLTALKNLQSKSPATAQEILQKQLEANDQGTWYADPQAILAQEGGREALDFVAAAQGVSSEELYTLLQSGAPLSVDGAVVVQKVLGSPHEVIVRNHITLDADAPTLAEMERVTERAQEIQKEIFSGLNLAEKKLEERIKARIPGSQIQQKIIKEIVLRNPNDPELGWEHSKRETQDQLDAFLEPFYQEIITSEKQAPEVHAEGEKTLSGIGEDPGSSFSPGITPEIRNRAYDMATGKISSAVYDQISPEEAMDLSGQIGRLKNRIQDLEEIQPQMKYFNKKKVELFENLTPEGEQAYEVILEMLQSAAQKIKNEKARRSASMGAILYARYADVYARVMREAGHENYTAMDYVREKLRIVGGETFSGATFSQPVTNLSLYENMNVPVVDISENAAVDVSSNQGIKRIANSLIGKTFEIQGSTEKGIGRVATISDGKHLAYSSRKWKRTDPSRRKAFDSIDQILKNAVFVEKHDNRKDPESGRKFIRLYSAAWNQGKLVVFRIVAEEKSGNTNYHEVVEANYYDLLLEKEIEPSRVMSEDMKGEKALSSITVADLLATVNDVEGNPYVGSDGNLVYNQAAFHGSPHKFDKFSLDAIGSGEGAQAYGWGLYFAGDKKVSEWYRERLAPKVQEVQIGNFTYKRTNAFGYDDAGFAEFDSNSGDFIRKVGYANADDSLVHVVGHLLFENASVDKIRKSAEKELKDSWSPGYWEKVLDLLNQNPVVKEDKGQLYKVNVPEDEVLLDWNKTLDEQSPAVKKIIKNIISFFEEEHGVSEDLRPDMGDPGETFYNYVGLAADPYDSLKDSPEIASKYLNSMGIKGIKYLDGNSRRSGEGSHNYVIFDDQAIEIIETFYQDRGTDTRGLIQITKNGQKVISLLENADQSTFVHEMSHAALADLLDLAQIENAPEWIQTDLKTVQVFLGWKEGQVSFTEEQQEKWAGHFEAYLMSGEAPTKGLRKVFRMFRTWLLQIYKDFAELGGRATPEVEAVMTRLIASQEEIELQEKEQEKLRNKNAAKQTVKDSRSRYQKWIDEANYEAEEKLAGFILKDLQDLSEEEIRKRLENERESFLSSLQDEKIRKDEAIWEESGDSILESLGYLSKEDFHEQLQKAGGKKADLLRNHLSEYERNLKSPPINPLELREQAKALLYSSEYREQAIAFELEAMKKGFQDSSASKRHEILRREVGQLRETAKQAAEDSFDRLKLTDATNAKLWMNKDQTAARKSLEAFSKGNLEEAIRAKSLQLTYARMAKMVLEEATKTNKALEQIRNRYKAINRQANRQKMPLAERYYINLLAYEMGIAKAAPAVPRTEILDLSGLMKNYTEQHDAADATLPMWLLPRLEGHSVGMDRITVAEFHDLKDLLSILYKVGKNKDQLLSLNISLDDLMEFSLLPAYERNFREDKKVAFSPNAPERKNIGSGKWTETYLLNLMNMDMMIGIFGEEFTNSLSRLSHIGATREVELTAQTQRKLKEVFSVYSEKERRSMNKKKIFALSDGSSWTKEELLCVALNWGTETGKERVITGHGIKEAEIQTLFSNLDKRDWDFVENIWKLNQSFWNETAEIEERMTGVVLQGVEALPFDVILPDGTGRRISGGYYHIAYNPEKSIRIQGYEQEEYAKSQMPRNAIFGTRQGFKKSRAAKFANPPLLLDFSVISSHLTDAIHNNAQRESIRDLKKIIDDYRFRMMIEESLGREAYQKITQWAKDQWGEEKGNPNDRLANQAMKKFRITTNLAIMGFNTSTALLNAANIAPMINQLGIVDTTAAITEFYANPKTNYAFCMENFPLLRERASTMDASLSELTKAKTGIKRLDQIKDISYLPIVYTDMMLSMPAAMKTYQRSVQKQLEKSKNMEVTQEIHDKAVFEADRVIRNIFGSGLKKDQAAIQKGSEINRVLTPFYSFFSAQLNVVLSDYYQGKLINGADKKKFARAIFLNFIVAASISACIRRLKDSDDDDGSWFGEFLKELAGTGMGGFVGLRDAVNIVLSYEVDGYIYSNGRPTSLPMTIYERFSNAYQTTRKVMEDRGTKDWIDVGRDTSYIFDAAFGVPDAMTNAFWASIRFFSHDTEADLSDWIRSVIFKKKLHKEKK